MNKICVISMSGGLDSTTLAYKAISEGYTILPINIKYGQKNVVEMQAFKKVIQEIKKKYPDNILEPVILNLQEMLKSSLELYQSIRDSGKVEDATEMEFYTPSRNLVFSTLAAMIGEISAIASGQTQVSIGLGVHKHSDIYPRDYWDITPEFVKRLNYLFELNPDVKITMYSPYADKFKSEIVSDGQKLGIDFSQTWTCYDPVVIPMEKTIVKAEPCHKCEACQERELAGKQAGVDDINSYSLVYNSLSSLYSQKEI